MTHEPSLAERAAALNEYRVTIGISAVPRIMGTDEHGYAALIYYWETANKAISPAKQKRLLEQGFSVEQFQLFMSFEATGEYPESSLRSLCAVADALIALEADGGHAFDMHRALGNSEALQAT